MLNPASYSKTCFIFVVLFLSIIASACQPNKDPSAKTVAASNGEAGQDRLQILALGDSYTIGQGGAPQDRWPVLLANILRESGLPTDHPSIVAANGWTSSDLLSTLQGTRFSEVFDVVTVMVGVNNQYRGESVSRYGRELGHLLESAVSAAGGKRDNVWLLNIPDWQLSPYGKDSAPQGNGGIDDFNRAAKRVAEKHRVNWLDISAHIEQGKFDNQYFVRDGLHYSRKMHMLWAMDLANKIQQKQNAVKN